MPVPAVVPVLIWGYRAYQAYEAAVTIKETAQLLAEIEARKKQVKQVLRTTIESLSGEIDTKSSTYELVDRGGNRTVSRRGAEAKNFEGYIERKVPFRPAISQVCRWALASPIKVSRRLRKKIPGEAIESTIEVALKQTTASLVFEAIDSALNWMSPIKAEPNYSLSSRKPALDREVPTKSHRISQIFPFWPRPRGCVSPDLVIVEYRQQPCEVENVLVAVEIKFPGDWVDEEQLEKYDGIMGGKKKKKVALLRVPEDCTDIGQDPRTKRQPKTPDRKRRR